MHRRIAVIIFTVLLFIPTLTNAQTETWAIKVLESDDKHVLVELTLPDFEQTPININGLTYQRLQVDDTWGLWGETGQPALPMFSQLIGLPVGSSGLPHDGQATIEVVVSESDAYHINIAPQPDLTNVFRIDNLVYQTDTTFPNSHVVQLTEPGWLRYQPVVQLHFYPFQYNPVQQSLTVYKRLRVKITYPTVNKTNQQPVSASPAFEKILQQSLLNYAELSRPKMGSRRGRQMTALATPSQMKITVQQDGFYKISQADIQQAAPDLLTVDPRHLELIYQGAAIPMFVEGEQDGQFDSGDYLIFYGQSIDSLYTADNIYWLRDKSSQAVRMTQKDGSLIAGYTTPADFPMTHYYEENEIYWQGMPNGEGLDHWFWDSLTGSKQTTDLTFNINNIANITGTLELAVHSATYGERTTKISLNNQTLHTETWSGRSQKLFQLIIPANSYNEGNNQLTIENTPAGNIGDTVDLYIDEFSVNYHDTYIVENNTLRFGVPSNGDYTFKLTNFSTASPIIFDITNSQNPQMIENIDTTQIGSKLNIRFSDQTAINQQYWLQRFDQWLTPQLLELDEGSLWRSPAHGATYLIITHASFYNDAQTLATYRSNHGESVAVVKVGDIYDEFNGGIKSPQAIRDFLQFTYQQWSPKPEYVLLVGDASLDPKNYRGNSKSDLLPASFVSAPLYGEAPSDHRYTTINGNDEYPDLIIGRLPVQDSQQLKTSIAKIEQYEQNPPPGNWIREALLIAHDENPQFEADMEDVANLLPDSIKPVKMYDRALNSPYHIQDEVVDTINNGVLIVAYSGHGNQNLWAKGYTILHSNDTNRLTNGYKLPFVTSANCSTGAFADYSNDIFAENLLFRQNGGIIAIWSPSSYGFPTPNSVLQNNFYTSLVVDSQFQPGVAANIAQSKSLQQDSSLLDFFKTFNYLGDPALKLEVPVGLELTGTANSNSIYMGNTVRYTLNYAVSGVNPARDVTLVNTLPNGLSYLSAEPAPSSIYANQQTWSFGDVATNTQAAVIITARVSNGLSHQAQITNTAYLYDSYGGGPTIDIKTTVFEQAISGLTVTQNGPVLLGQAVNLVAGVGAGSKVSFVWDFGNGKTGSGSSVQHSYTATGIYPVSLTANNSVNQPSTSVDVEILSTPVASFTLDNTAEVNQDVGLKNESESGADPNHVQYAWDFGNNLTSTIVQPTLIYTQTGVYEVQLTVANRLAQNSLTQTVTVIDAPVEGVAVISQPTYMSQTGTFTATAERGNNITYTWNFGDGSSIISQCCLEQTAVMTHVYTQTGVYTVELTAMNNSSETISMTIQVYDVPPTAMFQSSTPDILGEATIFESQYTGTNLTHWWNFGDASPVISTTQITISHVYTNDGDFPVTLTITNSQGSSEISHDITIIREITTPQASFISNSPVQLDRMLVLTNTSSDGGDRSEDVSYEWHIENITSTDKSISHQFGQIGTYPIQLTIKNSLSNDSITQTIVVTDAPIEGLEIIEQGATIFGELITLTAKTERGSNIRFDWQTNSPIARAESSSSKTFQLPTGKHTIHLTATNGVSQKVISHTITVKDAPIINLSLPIETTRLQLGQQLWLTATQEQGSNISYIWDWGDGQSYVTTQAVVSHTYQQNGVYTVTVTANNEVSQQTSSTTITILSCEPIRELAIDISTAIVGQTTMLSATHISGTEVSYAWNLGDETTIMGGPTISHTYTSLMANSVELTATNCWGNLTKKRWLEVQDEALAELTIQYPTPILLSQPITFTAMLNQGTNPTFYWQIGEESEQIGSSLTHQFEQAGRYSVAVRAVNSQGSISHTVEVTVGHATQSLFLPVIMR
ncbi:PKD domain-containing protein [Anaerolineales bacterium HSG25]|nr:PKD domain-containing protein [Anaerolineales bacterium HSG25]